MKGLAVTLAVACCLAETTTAFPNGAPVDACIRNKTLPNHAGTEKQDESTLRHEFVADSGHFGNSGHQRGPSSIDVHVRMQGAPIKGFFIEAMDDDRNPIGSFLKNDFSKLHSECSAITHNNPGPKKDITVTWVPPSTHSGGNVYFRGTFVEKYDTYWSKIFAKVLRQGHL